MTKYLIFILFLLFCQFCFANKIDDLKTDKDVERFLTEINQKSGNKILKISIIPTDTILKHCDSVVKTWNIKNWEKVDINNDGITDLLFISDYISYLAIDKENDRFEIIPIKHEIDSGGEFATLLNEKNQIRILFHWSKTKYDPKASLITNRQVSVTDTLIYKFNSLVEENTAPNYYNIDSIYFNTGMCFGTCPVFSIISDKAGNATYKAEMYPKKRDIFKCKIDKQNLDEIFGVINYISIKKLDNHYTVDWTDYPTCTIRIKFHDGSVKQIEDYGELGTFGLRKLYADLSNLRENQKWLAVK